MKASTTRTASAPGLRWLRLAPANIHALTGMDPADVDQIAEVTDPGHTRGRPRRFSHRDRVLLVLVALRTNLTERALAALFGVSQSTTHRTIRDLMRVIADQLNPVPAEEHAEALASDFDPGTTLLLDGTLIPVHDQSITRPSKNYRRSVNVQVMATSQRRIVYVSPTWPGNRNDIVLAKATITLPHPGHRHHHPDPRRVPIHARRDPATQRRSDPAGHTQEAPCPHRARPGPDEGLADAEPIPPPGNSINHAVRAVAHL